MMKRVFFGVAALLVLVQVAVFADRKAVDDYLKSYEAVVVETETLAEKATIGPLDLLPLQQKALDFSQKALAVQTDTTWSLQDSTKLLALTERYNKALETITKKM
jgi:hypothetical protein